MEEVLFDKDFLSTESVCAYFKIKENQFDNKSFKYLQIEKSYLENVEEFQLLIGGAPILIFKNDLLEKLKNTQNDFVNFTSDYIEKIIIPIYHTIVVLFLYKKNYLETLHSVSEEYGQHITDNFDDENCIYDNCCECCAPNFADK